MLRPILWNLVFFGVLAWSAIAPKDYPTWFLEVVPALVGAIAALGLLSRWHDRLLAKMDAQ